MPKRPFISKVQNYVSTPSNRGITGTIQRQFMMKTSGLSNPGPLLRTRAEKKSDSRTLPTSTRTANKMQFQQTQHMPVKLMTLRSKETSGGGS